MLRSSMPASANINEAFTWLERAWDERSPSLGLLLTERRLDALRSDPRFLDLLKRTGLQR